jgi:hypothetical protein
VIVVADSSVGICVINSPASLISPVGVGNGVAAKVDVGVGDGAAPPSALACCGERKNNATSKSNSTDNPIFLTLGLIFLLHVETNISMILS